MTDADLLIKLMIFGLLSSFAFGVMGGILIKHWLDLPYLLACEISSKEKAIEVKK